jgi:2-methylcitrate dehydratase PrpD
MAESGSDVSAHTKTLAEFIARSPDRALPPDVVAKTKSHILDTIAAIVSGSRLRAGRLAAEYVQSIGGNPEALVLGTPLILPAISAAMANGKISSRLRHRAGRAGHWRAAGEERDRSHSRRGAWL